MDRILIINDKQELCLLIRHSILSENIEADFCKTRMELIGRTFLTYRPKRRIQRGNQIFCPLNADRKADRIGPDALVQ